MKTLTLWNNLKVQFIRIDCCGLSTAFYSFQFVYIQTLLAEKKCSGSGRDVASTFSTILYWAFLRAWGIRKLFAELLFEKFSFLPELAFYSLHCMCITSHWFCSELPVIKRHTEPQLSLTGRLMIPDIKSGLPSGPYWRMIIYPMSFHTCEVGCCMLQINVVTGRKCSLTRKRFSDN